MSDVDNLIPEIVKEIHSRPEKAVIVVTGAGISALGWLLDQGGAPRTLLRGRVPYSISSLNEYVGGASEPHITPKEAITLTELGSDPALQLRPAADHSLVTRLQLAAPTPTA